MTDVDAFHLPGLTADDVVRWHVREYGDAEVRLRTPVLQPAAIGRIAERLRAARARHLAELPVAAVVDAIAATAARLADPADPHRRIADAALPAATGYSPPMARLILDRMLADWRADALDSLLRAEFGDPAVLDAFRPGPRPGTRVRALGPALAFHIFAGNVPGVAVAALIRSLLVKAATFGKSASGDPLLPALFARTLADVSPELGTCIAITYWAGGTTTLEAAALDAADAVVVYGGADTVRDVRARVPAETRLIVHGPRISFALIGREALTEDAADRTAALAARATALFDQQGCVSPHVLYVEQGGDVAPEDFAARVSAALERLRTELPRGRLTAAEAAVIHQVRGAAEFRTLDGQDVRIFAGPGTEHTVIYEADPTFTPSCLHRVVSVKPLLDLADAVERVRPYARYLQTVGIVGAGKRRDALAERFARAGASRITGLETMPWPPAAWHHDGQEPLRELIRWVDLED
ncbi:MAG TPA: acyl-CoA reductase [Longimicrobiales bacterium]